MAEWKQLMRGIGSDGEGILPGGTLETLQSEGKGGDPVFVGYLKRQDEQIVMAATSGKLTMLSEATGLGSGNSEAHADTFDEIALALAMDVSEVFQEQFDGPFLDAIFPGEERLVYFELAAKDESDVGQTVKHASDLATAGYDIDTAELSEKTGYKITRRPETPHGAEFPETPNGSGFSPNRKTGSDFRFQAHHRETPNDLGFSPEDLAPDVLVLLDRLTAATGEEFAQVVAELERQWPKLARQVMAAVDAGDDLAAVLAEALNPELPA